MNERIRDKPEGGTASGSTPERKRLETSVAQQVLDSMFADTVAQAIAAQAAASSTMAPVAPVQVDPSP